MMSHGDPAPIRAFWSYARTDERGTSELFLAMRDNLRGATTRRHRLEIFRDNDPDSGIGVGRHWDGDVVANLAGSVLFFWVQSPSWLGGPVCVLEYDMFRAQTERIAAHFAARGVRIDADQLWDGLVIPILWRTPNADQWTEYPDAIRERFRPIWRARQVRPELNFVQSPAGQAHPNDRCHTVASAILNRLYDIMPGQLPALLEFVATPDRGFVDAWRKRFSAAPDRHRPVASPGAPPRPRDINGLACFWAVDGDPGTGFWAARAPLERLPPMRTPEPLSPRHQPVKLADGHIGWDAAAAADIARTQRPEGRCLPDPARASVLRRIFARGPNACTRVGWRAPVDNFWCQSADGAITPAAGALDHLPIILVSQTE